MPFTTGYDNANNTEVGACSGTTSVRPQNGEIDISGASSPLFYP